MREHPDRETLKKFISGQLASEDARLTDRHLAVCSECRDLADEISNRLALQLLDSWLRPNYDEAFERAADGAAQRSADIWAEGKNTEDLLSDLLREPSPGRRRRIANDDNYHKLKLCELLRLRSREQWSSNRAVALEMADLAVEVARHLDTTRYGSNLVEDARALAWAHLGNSFRVTSDLWRAEQALLQAWRHHAIGEGDAYTEAELLTFTSSLRLDQGNYEEAVRFSDKAIPLYREVQDHYLEGATLILKGHILGFCGTAQEAIAVTRQGLACIEPVQDPRLLITGKHNLICNLCIGGELKEAWKLLQQSRPLYENLGRMDFARLRWLEGNFAMDLSQFHEAESAFCETREFFLDSKMVTEVIYVSVDLAEVYARQGLRKRVKEVLEKVIPLAEALGVQENLLAVRLLYEQASRA